MRAILLFLLSACILPYTHVHAQEFNAGFVQGLWYSQEMIFAENTVRIYVAIRNNTGSDLTGTVEFFDNNERIDRKAVQALDGRIIESWADWNPDYGEHTLSASLTRIELHTIGSSTQAVEVTSALAEDIIFVDFDTDNDGIGNTDDTDDDGDHISDTQEEEDGTDPLVFNEQPTEETSEAETEDTTKENDPQDTARDTRREGLERYLNDSPAEEMLSGITNTINDSKRALDDYRARRSVEREQSTSTEVSADGFGAVSYASSTASSSAVSNVIEGIISLLTIAITSAYTLALAVVSFVLSYPLLLQIGVLLGILFLLFKTASKFGRRPKHRGS